MLKVMGLNPSAIYCMEFFYNNFFKIVLIFVWKRLKINKKEARDGPFKKDENKYNSIKNRVDVLDVPDCEDDSGRPDCRVAHDVWGGRNGNGPGNAHLDHNVRSCG